MNATNKEFLFDVEAAAIEYGVAREHAGEHLVLLAVSSAENYQLSEFFGRDTYAHRKIGEIWVSYGSDAKGREDLAKRREKHCTAMAKADSLAAAAKEVVPGCLLADARGVKEYNLDRLIAGMEARPGVRLTVVHKDDGYMSLYHGGEEVLVTAAKEGPLSVQELLPPKQQEFYYLNDGIACNNWRQATISRAVWEKKVLPAFMALPQPA